MSLELASVHAYHRSLRARAAGDIAGLSYPMSSMEDLTRKETALTLESDAFHRQQGSFHSEAPLISTESPVRSNGPVTGNYYGKRVVGQGRTNRSSTLGIAQVPGDSLIRAHRSPRDSIFGAQDLLLERGAQIQTRDVEGEADILSGQKCHHLVGNDLNLSA